MVKAEMLLRETIHYLTLLWSCSIFEVSSRNVLSVVQDAALAAVGGEQPLVVSEPRTLPAIPQEERSFFANSIRSGGNHA